MSGQPGIRVSTEAALTGIWSKVLGRPAVGVHDNFFMLGGTSMKLAQMVALAHRAGLGVELSDAFEQPTIAALAKAVSRDDDPRPDGPDVREVVFGPPAPSRRAHVVLTSAEDLPVAAALSAHVGVRGVAVHALTPTWREDRPYAPYATLSAAVAERLTAVDGITLAGDRAAAPLAAALACRLHDLGRRVDRLVLLDTPAPGPHMRGAALDRLVPEDGTDRDALRAVRETLAAIRRDRVEGNLDAAAAMDRAWTAAKTAAADLVTGVVRADVSGWTAPARAGALANFMARLNLVVGQEEPLGSRLPADIPVVALASGETDDDAHARGSAWQRALGGDVSVAVDPVPPHLLLASHRLAALLCPDT